MGDEHKRNQGWIMVWCTLAVIFFGYQVGKDAALRDNRLFGPRDNR
jgi:hypothetical protein